MFEVAVENDRVERSPVRKKLHRPSTEDGTKTRKVALSAEAIQQVLSWIPEEYRTLFTFVAMTGVRVGELLGLRRSNVDFGRSEMSVTHTFWRRELVTPKTEAGARTIHLPEVLTTLLAERKDSVRFNSPDDFVFGRADGAPQDPNYLRKKVLYEAMKAVGIKPGHRTHGFHIFRHS
jgi:integrase